MIRAERLVVSRPMYAFKPETWRPAIGGIGFEPASGVHTPTSGSPPARQPQQRDNRTVADHHR